jgi:hypothetical protein
LSLLSRVDLSIRIFCGPEDPMIAFFKLVPLSSPEGYYTKNLLFSIELSHFHFPKDMESVEPWETFIAILALVTYDMYFFPPLVD